MHDQFLQRPKVRACGLATSIYGFQFKTARVARALKNYLLLSRISKLRRRTNRSMALTVQGACDVVQQCHLIRAETLIKSQAVTRARASLFAWMRDGDAHRHRGASTVAVISEFLLLSGAAASCPAGPPSARRHPWLRYGPKSHDGRLRAGTLPTRWRPDQTRAIQSALMSPHWALVARKLCDWGRAATKPSRGR